MISIRAASAFLLIWVGSSSLCAAPKPYTQQLDVVYGEADGVGLIMDVFTPTGPKNGIGIVDLASGAWFSDRGKIRDHIRAGFYDVFCGRGYTVFAVRPGSISKFSALEMLAHIKQAIRYIKYNAKNYAVDPERLGLTGASAGGHLSCLTAVTADDGKPGSKTLEGMNTHVKAVGVFFPPTNFLDYGGKEVDFNRLGHLFFPGGIKDKTKEEIVEEARKISPALHITKSLPPFLFIHGNADKVVPLQQSEFMVSALKRVGVSVELIVKEGGAHPWPTIREEVVLMANWFDKNLNPKEAN